MARGGWFLLALLTGLFLPCLALAEEPDTLAQARAAYARGAQAYDVGDYAEAAKELARADELVPNAVALELALHAAMKGDDPVAGMMLAERAAGREGAIVELAASARAKFAARVGQLEIVCPAGTACRASVDGAELGTGAPHWIAVGDHQVELYVEGATERRQVHIDAGKRVELTPVVPTAKAPAAPAPAPGPRPVVPAKAPPPLAEEQRISPGWFWTGVAVTALGTAGIIASGVDTVNKRDDFLQRPSDETEGAGRSAQLRTNILLGVTGALALGTVALGVVTYWPASSKASASLRLSPTVTGMLATARY